MAQRSRWVSCSALSAAALLSLAGSPAQAATGPTPFTCTFSGTQYSVLSSSDADLPDMAPVQPKRLAAGLRHNISFSRELERSLLAAQVHSVAGSISTELLTPDGMVSTQQFADRTRIGNNGATLLLSRGGNVTLSALAPGQATVTNTSFVMRLRTYDEVGEQSEDVEIPCRPKDAPPIVDSVNIVPSVTSDAAPTPGPGDSSRNWLPTAGFLGVGGLGVAGLAALTWGQQRRRVEVNLPWVTDRTG